MKTTLALLAAGVAISGAAPADAAEYQCLIEPFQKIELRSAVEALIESVLVERGSVVRKGQPLVRLNSGVEEASLASARYRAIMEGQVRSSTARVELAREKYRRRSELSLQNFISAQDRDDSLAEMKVAEADLVEAKDNRELSALESKRLEELLRQRTLVSPFNGIVTELLQNPGELAQTGEGARPILRMVQIHPLRVEVVLPVSAYDSIKRGTVAEVEAEAPSRSRHKATVQIVDKVVDSASGTFGVRLELPNPNGNILAGVKCKVSFR